MGRVLVITPSFSGGSWVATEKVLNALLTKNVNIFAVGLGEVTHRNKRLRYFSIPYPKYVSWGAIHSRTPLLALLWNLPLSLVFIFILLYNRPNLVIANGFSSSLLISPFIKLIRVNYVVMYHGNILGFLSKRTKKVIKSLSKFVDLVVVNSKGGFEDIGVVIPKRKILINEHFADDLFFKKNKEREKKPSKLTVLYVGSLNKEKLFFPLVEVAKKLKNHKKFKFIFAGVGSDQAEVEELSRKASNILFLGYVGDRNKLKDLYCNSDVLWSFADETYLGIPAAESLATGTPIIVPKYPALSQKEGLNKIIKKDIVPDEIGWLVDTNNIEECYKLIQNIQKKGISELMKKNCYEYALEHYNPKNLDKTIERINYFLK